MVSSISPQTSSLAFEMSQLSARSNLSSADKIEKLNYEGLSEEEKASLRQNYSNSFEDGFQILEGFEEDENYNTLQDLEASPSSQSNNKVNYTDPADANKDGEVSTAERIKYLTEEYSKMQAPEIETRNAEAQNLQGYAKFNYNKINSLYGIKNSEPISNIKLYA